MVYQPTSESLLVDIPTDFEEIKQVHNNQSIYIRAYTSGTLWHTKCTYMAAFEKIQHGHDHQSTYARPYTSDTLEHTKYTYMAVFEQIKHGEDYT